jgi:hypothetical protein
VGDHRGPGVRIRGIKLIWATPTVRARAPGLRRKLLPTVPAPSQTFPAVNDGRYHGHAGVLHGPADRLGRAAQTRATSSAR